MAPFTYTPNKKLSDIYSGLFQNPVNPMKNVVPTPLTPGATPFTPVERTLPNGGGSYASPVVAQPQTPVPAKAPAIVTPQAGVQAPTQPVGNTPTGLDYSKYTDPLTGKILSPQEYADSLAKRVVSGSVPSYAGDALTGGIQTREQIAGRATDLNNERNDIATGTTDPYKVASQSGIAYSPAELSAIEKSYAGIYDPALKNVFAKLEKKDKEDSAALENKSKLEQMAQQHKYDLELKALGNNGTGNSNQMTDNERAAQTLFQGNQIVKDYNTVVNQKNTIDKIISNGVGGPADVSTIFTFMKALDPNSVVRESEYDKAAASGNLFQGAWTKFNGYFKDKGGILPENVKQEFQNLVNQKLAAQGMSYKNLADRTKEIAKRQGMNPDNVVIDFSGAIEEPSAGAGPEWMNSYDYEKDIKDAKEAIAQGADSNAVKERLSQKYKTVDL